MSVISSSDDRRRNPAFHIQEPNPLLGNRSAILMNKEMCRSICELIEQSELSPDERHLYAFAKRLRAHYQRIAHMYRDRAEAAEEHAAAALDTPQMAV